MWAPRTMLLFTRLSNCLESFCSMTAACLFNGSSGLGSCRPRSSHYGVTTASQLQANQPQESHQKQELQAVDDGADAEHRLPVLPKYVQAHVAVQVDVGVVHLHPQRLLSTPALRKCECTVKVQVAHLRLALDLWCVVWIRGGHVEAELKLPEPAWHLTVRAAVLRREQHIMWATCLYMPSSGLMVTLNTSSLSLPCGKSMLVPLARLSSDMSAAEGADESALCGSCPEPALHTFLHAQLARALFELACCCCSILLLLLLLVAASVR